MKKNSEEESDPFELSVRNKAFITTLSNDFEIDEKIVEPLFSYIVLILAHDEESSQNLRVGGYANHYFNFETTTFLQELLQIFQGPGVKIEYITVSTTKGNVRINRNSILFRHFNYPIKYIKAHCKRVLDDRAKNSHDKITIEAAEKQVLFSIHSWKIKKFKKCVIAGLILLHFKIDHCGTLLSEEEFYDSDKIEAPNYYAYLYNVMKSRFRAIEKMDKLFLL